VTGRRGLRLNAAAGRQYEAGSQRSGERRNH
jgi:hypothetical protein